MRYKENRLVITFHSTTEAMEAEKRLKELGVPGRLIPIPRQLSAGCGLAWCAEPEEKEQIARIMEEKKIEKEALHEMLV